ncbi:MAG: protein kinase [Gemmatimonadales bacterium]
MSAAEALATALADRYRIERPLGAGGMATVYLATDLKHDREVALKVLRPELGAVLGSERFLAEIKISARLDHPHILTLIDSGEAAGFLYYVLPVVRGESLREKLNREKQLGVEDAVAIAKQVAGALDFAHKKGIVHRDIKPENILLQEGEAMLTDFGIALAVREAGGNRLTETGLSLGTPQYMSPEQATGDRLLDARSDVYSLAAVLYEMLAGEPPVTGPNAQAMIAKLMTERPTHLRVVRPSVPPEIDAAVARALDKTPADRFPSAAEFARALEIRPVTPTLATPAVAAPKSRSGLLVAGAVAAIALASSGYFALSGKSAPRAKSFGLKDRTQITFSGSVYASAISADGKQLAFIDRNCGDKGCSYSVDVQDVGGTTTHRVLDGASAAYGLEWSPDRRNLLMVGTINKRWGLYLLSALGGPPRYLTSAAAMFWSNGDSLLVAPPVANDSVFYVKVTGIDGRLADSIRVAGPGPGISGLSVSPNGKWIVALVVQNGRGLWQVFDRQGKVADRVVNSCTCAGRITNDALWLTRSGIGFESIVRISLDPATGKLATQQDTLLSGKFNNFSVTADGSSLVLDDGTDEYNLWSVPLADALKGKFPASSRLVQSSTPIGAGLSKDGKRILLFRDLPASTGGIERRYSVMPTGGGTEVPLNTLVKVRGARWVDSVTIGYVKQTEAGMHVGLVDARTGQAGRSIDLPDSIITDVAPLPDGWAWIPANGDRIQVQRGGSTISIPKPAFFYGMFRLLPAPDGKSLFVMGWNASTVDSAVVAAVPIGGGAATVWASDAAEDGGFDVLPDGSLLFMPFDTPRSQVLYRVRAPGQMERLGSVPKSTLGVSPSHDLKSVVVLEQLHRGDAYRSLVVQQ